MNEQLERSMKCIKCMNDLFKIKVISNCSECENNGAWDNDEDVQEYIYDSEKIKKNGLMRDQVNEDGECGFGTAYGAGCHLYICASCGHEDYLPLYSD